MKTVFLTLIAALFYSCSNSQICGYDQIVSESVTVTELPPWFITADMYTGDTLRIPSGSKIGLGRGIWYEVEQLDVQFIIRTTNHTLLGDSAGWFVGWRCR